MLTIPYITGGISHFLPLYVLHHKYLKDLSNYQIDNNFLVNKKLQYFLSSKKTNSLSIDYSISKDLIYSNNPTIIYNLIKKKEQQAVNIVKPSLIVEDTSIFSPLIAEKNNIPRISIQRTGIFRTIDKSKRNLSHHHSLENGSLNIDLKNTPEFTNPNEADLTFLHKYLTPKVKLIPGIPSIERLPDNTKEKESYFYCGPLLIKDKVSEDLSLELTEFERLNNGKKIVFITTGTIDQTPIGRFIEFFVLNNYAVITTNDTKINNNYRESVFYKNLLPLNHICELVDLVVHQCGSGMYHYPILNKVSAMTIGTQCYDREDVALRLQELGVSGHIPHPNDDEHYWEVFLELFNKFENNTLTDFEILDKLKIEIEERMHNFNMEDVINYALS